MSTAAQPLRLQPNAMTRVRVAAVALSLMAGAICLPWRHVEPTSKFDRALQAWIAHPTSQVRVLRSTPSEAAAQRVRRRVGAAPLVSESPRLLVATRDADGLRAIAAAP